MPYIAPDYFRGEMLIDLLSVHDISRRTAFSRKLIYARRQTSKRELSGVSPVFHRRHYMVAQKIIRDLRKDVRLRVVSGDLDLNLAWKRTLKLVNGSLYALTGPRQQNRPRMYGNAFQTIKRPLGERGARGRGVHPRAGEGS
jgi:hypothetical protein